MYFAGTNIAVEQDRFSGKKDHIKCYLHEVVVWKSLCLKFKNILERF
jgi:hypothetical protein